MTEHTEPLKLNEIFLEDCLVGMKKMPDNSVDVVITDPDYGVGINYDVEFADHSVGVARKTTNELEKELVPILKECYRVSRRDIVFFWSGSIERIHDFLHIVELAGLNTTYMGIWYKPNGAGPSGNGLGRRFEVWFWIKGKNPRSSEWEFLPDVLVHNRITPKDKEGVKHPTQKPLDLMIRLVRFFSNEGDTVLDPFMGSGTTAIACKLTGRNYVGFEINPDYIEIANKRLLNITKEVDVGRLFV